MASSDEVGSAGLIWSALTACVAVAAYLFKQVFKTMASKEDLAKAEIKMADKIAEAIHQVRDADNHDDEKLIAPLKEKLEMLVRLRDSDRADQDRRHAENLQALAVISGDIKQLLSQGRTPGH